LVRFSKKYSVIVLGACAFGTASYAEEGSSWTQYIPSFIRQYIPGLTSEKPTAVFGPASFNSENLPFLDVMGPASLTDVKVEGKTNIQGPLDAKGSKLNGLEVSGPVSLQGTTVTGQAMINGPLSLESGSSIEDLSIAAHKIVIKDSTVINIVVRKSDASQEKQVIYLEGGAKVTGTIKFEQEGGQVITRDTAHIDGAVIGGETITGGHEPSAA